MEANGVAAVIDTKNVDKRTSRRQHRAEFSAAVATFRQQRQGSQPPPPQQQQQPQPQSGGAGGLAGSKLVLQVNNGPGASGAGGRRGARSGGDSSKATGADTRGGTATAAGGLGGMRVLARKRPLFEHEVGRGEFDAVSCVSARQVVVHDAKMRPDMRGMYMDHHEFTFDEVFDESATNDAVYQSAAAPLVRLAAGGGFATAMMFGQTGSGKTYTMSGIYERACAELFEQLSGSSGDSMAPTVSVSFVEVAGTSCRDMLNNGAAVKLRTDGEGYVLMQGVTEAGCLEAQDLMTCIHAATKLRATSATGVHDQSSRSHAICRVFVRRQPPPAPPWGQFTMVDLAGSERRQDSAMHDAARRKESAEINSSLMALKECIRARVAQEAGATKVHVPYRDNKLTQLLKQTFTLKEASTIVIATISPTSADTEHSLRSLHHSCLMDGQHKGGSQVGTTTAMCPVRVRSPLS
jgi:kinesin family protein 2/24